MHANLPDILFINTGHVRIRLYALCRAQHVGIPIEKLYVYGKTEGGFVTNEKIFR